MNDPFDEQQQAPAGHEHEPLRVPEFCRLCVRQRRGNEFKCPAWVEGPEGPERCGGLVYGYDVRGNPPKKRVQEADGGDLEGVLSRVVPRLPWGWVLLMFGGKGSGKTTVAMDGMPGAHYIPTEMSPATAIEYANRIGTTVERISVPIPDGEGGLFIPALDPSAPRLSRELIIDSLTSTRRALAVLDAVRAYCSATGARCIAISHATKKGEMAGLATIEHEADIVVRAERAGTSHRLVAEKNRSGPMGSLQFELGPDGARVPGWGRYFYSVEGTPPDLWLEAFPSKRRLHFAGMLKAAKKGGDKAPKFPGPPVAVAAQDGGALYGGWVDPPDVAARMEYAHRHGMPFMDAKGAVHAPAGATTT